MLWHFIEENLVFSVDRCLFFFGVCIVCLVIDLQCKNYFTFATALFVGEDVHSLYRDII